MISLKKCRRWKHQLHQQKRRREELIIDVGSRAHIWHVAGSPHPPGHPKMPNPAQLDVFDWFSLDEKCLHLVSNDLWVSWSTGFSFLGCAGNIDSSGSERSARHDDESTRAQIGWADENAIANLKRFDLPTPPIESTNGKQTCHLPSSEPSKHRKAYANYYCMCCTVVVCTRSPSDYDACCTAIYKMQARAVFVMESVL